MGLLQSVAAPERSAVFLAVPALESVFFAFPADLERLIGARLTGELKVLSEFQPKRALDSLFREAGKSCDLADLRALVAGIGRDRLRTHPLMQEIIGFVSQGVPAGVGTH